MVYVYMYFYILYVYLYVFVYLSIHCGNLKLQVIKYKNVMIIVIKTTAMT